MTDERGPLPAPGSDENPIAIDPKTMSARSIQEYDHVHDLLGRCVKRRAGVRCTTGLEDVEGAEEQMREWLQDFDARVKPKMGESAIGMSVLNGWSAGQDFDSQAALEIGTLLLMGKPLIVVVGPDQELPPGIERAADVVVRGELGSPEMQERLQAAISSVIPQEGS